MQHENYEELIDDEIFNEFFETTSYEYAEDGGDVPVAAFDEYDDEGWTNTESPELIPSQELYERLADSFQTLNEVAREMTEEEAEDYIQGEWFQALIPLVTALAPAAARAIGGLVNKRRRPTRPATRPARNPPPRLTPRPAVPAQRPAPAPAGRGVSSFLALLQDPRVIRTLQQVLRQAR